MLINEKRFEILQCTWLATNFTALPLGKCLLFTYYSKVDTENAKMKIKLISLDSLSAIKQTDIG